jgi:tetratricopeptide (TPR) repeat protein
LEKYWQMHSLFDSQLEWLQVAYQCANALQNSNKKADFARRIGRVWSLKGDLDEALIWMNRSEKTLSQSNSEGADPVRALTYIHRSTIFYLKGETDCLRGLQLVDAKTQITIYAEGCNVLGVIKMKLGQLSNALASMEKSLLAWSELGDEYQISRVKDNRRTVLFYLGHFADLRREEDEAVKYWEQFPDRVELAMALTNRGLVHQVDGKYETAVDLQSRAIDISDRLAVPRMQAMTRANIAGPYTSLQKYDEAEKNLIESLEIQEKQDYREYWVDAHRSLAEVALGRENTDVAVQLAEEAVHFAKEDDDPLEIGAALRTLAQALISSDRLAQAKDYLEESLALLKGNEYRYETYLNLLVQAKLYAAMNESELAQTVLMDARSLAEEMGLNAPELI